MSERTPLAAIGQDSGVTVAIRPPMIVKPAIASVIIAFSRPATAGNSRTRPTARSASNR